MKRFKRIIRRFLLWKNMKSAGVSNPRGFFGPSFIGAEMIVVRGQMCAREVKIFCMSGVKDLYGPWRRISRQRWKNFATEAKCVDKSRICFGSLPKL